MLTIFHSAGVRKTNVLLRIANKSNWSNTPLTSQYTRLKQHSAIETQPPPRWELHGHCALHTVGIPSVYCSAALPLQDHKVLHRQVQQPPEERTGLGRRFWTGNLFHRDICGISLTLTDVVCATAALCPLTFSPQSKRHTARAILQYWMCMVTPLGDTNANRCETTCRSVGNFNQIPVNKCNVAMDTINLKYTRFSCVDSDKIIVREVSILSPLLCQDSEYFPGYSLLKSKTISCLTCNFGILVICLGCIILFDSTLLIQHLFQCRLYEVS